MAQGDDQPDSQGVLSPINPQTPTPAYTRVAHMWFYYIPKRLVKPVQVFDNNDSEELPPLDPTFRVLDIIIQPHRDGQVLNVRLLDLKDQHTMGQAVHAVLSRLAE